jgi:hypothetical protein
MVINPLVPDDTISYKLFESTDILVYKNWYFVENWQ